MIAIHFHFVRIERFEIGQSLIKNNEIDCNDTCNVSESIVLYFVALLLFSLFFLIR